MKIQMNNKSGFTLIEIIVVLIIVGVLASIALPNLFSNVAKAKGAEAVASFGPMKAAVEVCGQKNGGTYAACTATQLGTSGNYYYSMGSSACAGFGTSSTAYGDATGWCLKATPSGSTGDATNYITLNRNSATSIVCTGYGTYAGIC